MVSGIATALALLVNMCILYLIAKVVTCIFEGIYYVLKLIFSNTKGDV